MELLFCGQLHKMAIIYNMQNRYLQQIFYVIYVHFDSKDYCNAIKINFIALIL